MSWRIAFIFLLLGGYAHAQHVSRLGRFQVDEISGCAPFTGTITAAYGYASRTAEHSIGSLSGGVDDTPPPPPACGRSFPISYRFTLREQPVEVVNHTRSTVHVARDALRLIRDLFRIRARSRSGGYEISVADLPPTLATAARSLA